MQRWLRLKLFLDNDSLVTTYGSSKASVDKRAAVEAGAKKYIYQMAPKKFHQILTPDFPLGCKRRIFDPNYLETLNEENVSLIPEGIKRFDETGIVSDSGTHEEFDVIVLATGFQVQNFLTPMEIVGGKGQTLEDQWQARRGAQAYLGTYVHNFPNFAIM
jgi:cation diffusion facilitator CzcD-associated flavoprotein CzcO